MEKVTKVEWTETAKNALSDVFQFHAVNSEKSAETIVNEIIDTGDSIVFAKQYQVDNINPNYRRMIIRHYKIIYKEDANVVSIMNVIDTREDSDKLKNL